jgi:Holliday junction resolvase RusA-like endonuclease
MIKFTVVGIPQPAGSKRAFIIPGKDGAKGRAIVTDANPNARDWKNAVAQTAIESRNGAGPDLLTGPLSFTARFYRPRPQGHYGKAGLNKKGRETPFPTSKPDVLKLARGTEDALTGIIWRDDSLIVHEDIRKLWGEPARCEIEIREVVNRTALEPVIGVD